MEIIKKVILNNEETKAVSNMKALVDFIEGESCRNIPECEVCPFYVEDLCGLETIKETMQQIIKQVEKFNV